MSPKKTSRSPTTGVWFTTVTPKVGGPSAESVASNVRSGAFAGVSFGSSPTLAVFCASKKRRGQLSVEPAHPRARVEGVKRAGGGLEVESREARRGKRDPAHPGLQVIGGTRDVGIRQPHHRNLGRLVRGRSGHAVARAALGRPGDAGDTGRVRRDERR